MKTFPSTLDQLHRMLSFIRMYAEKGGFDRPEIAKMILASEEALVNILNTEDLSREEDLEIHCQVKGNEEICIVIKDKGKPYNPLANAKSPLLKGRPIIGEKGTYFLLRNMDEVTYCREKEMNVLTLVKRRTAVCV